ncbi:nuclease-related domain-containing DEAD/DEAH box helicase [Sinomonas mesophila]|uniref:nuclease-related domain-containing DEAD/DEAH box helicase n=1 Tax=Sinomonas mesophila TaxID=1531955 RepID=UPI00098423DA|nr:NERD domain-containing protein [Sinomonas mesophila]
MARSLPESPGFEAGHEAERAVWERLVDALPDDAVVCHSVQVRDGAAEHEIDLLVLWPHVGIACIEVKGGRVSVDGGQWYQSDRGGKHRIKSPVAQAQSAMHGYRNMVGDHLGTPLTSRMVYLAAFPYTDVPHNWTMAGVPRRLVLDRRDLDSPLDLAEALRGAIHAEASGHATLAPAYAARLERFVAGSLAEDDGGQGPAVESEDVQDTLTERQSVLLNATRSLRHVRFIGGAGSGKTWLAVEKAKRLCRQGLRVGLFCYNKGLGEHLARQTKRWKHRQPVFAGEFHEYALSLGVPPGSGQEYFDADMPRLLAGIGSRLDPSEKLDAIVVDEAQDFAPSWWEALLSCVRDPDRATVYAFMDSQQDVYRRWDGADLAQSRDAVVRFAPLHVDDNLRNTRRIAETFRCFAGEHFTPRTGTGLPVRLVQAATEDALDRASDCVDALLEDGWANNQIALLTTRRRHPIHQEAFDAGPEAVAEYWRAFHDGEGEFYGHVLGFKGLERSVVILCVDGFKEMARAAEQLYVGLSRARSLLVVVGDPEIIREAGGDEMARALASAEVWQP